MTFSAYLIDNLVYELKPYGLFLIEKSYDSFVYLKPKDQHKYVCTLCDYTIQLIHYLCTLTECNYTREGGFLVTRDGKQIINLLQNIHVEKVLLIVYYVNQGVGHVFGFIIDNWNCFRIESSLNDFSAQLKESTPNDMLGEIAEIILNGSVVRLKMVPIPPDEVLLANTMKIKQICKDTILKKRGIHRKMKNTYNLLTDPDYPTYEYHQP